MLVVFQMCMCELFRIHGWDALWQCCKEVQSWDPEGCESAKLDLSDEAMPSPDWKNKVTVYARGTVILRLSWDKPIQWNPAVQQKALNACRAICTLIRNCC